MIEGPLVRFDQSRPPPKKPSQVCEYFRSGPGLHRKNGVFECGHGGFGIGAGGQWV